MSGHLPFMPPSKGEKAFNCPNCMAYSEQSWSPLNTSQGSIPNFMVSQCVHCKNIAVWHHDSLIFPDRAAVPFPLPEMPDNVRADCDEARSVHARSPRSAAALLRLGIQKLMVHLGE